MHTNKNDGSYILIVITETGHEASALLASSIRPSSKVPIEVPLVVPLSTLDFPSESPSK